jgi:hypothetical protein
MENVSDLKRPCEFYQRLYASSAQNRPARTRQGDAAFHVTHRDEYPVQPISRDAA